MSGVSSQKRFSRLRMRTAVMMPVCVVEICVMSQTSRSDSSVGTSVVFAITAGSMTALTTCTLPLMCYRSRRAHAPTRTSRIQGISCSTAAMRSSRSVLSTTTRSTSEEGIIRPVREDP